MLSMSKHEKAFFRDALRSLMAAAMLLLLSWAWAKGEASAAPSRQEEIEALKKRIAELEQQVAGLQGTLAELKAKLEELQKAPPSPPPPGGLQLLNPEISVIFDGIGAFRNRRFGGRFSGFEFREAEVALQAAIDPFARADGFFAVTPEGVEVEEAYATLIDPSIFRLPRSLQFRGGIMKANLDKLNLIHRPEQPFVDLPLLHQRFFGEEGFAAPGLRMSWLAPTEQFLELSIDALSASNESFESEGGRPVFLGRVRTLFDFSSARSDKSLDLGFSFAQGPNDADEDTRLFALDLTYRWRPIKQGLYRSLTWQTEFFLSQREQPGGSRQSKGFFSFLEYQFSRTLFGSVRYDWAGAPDGSSHENGVSLGLTFFPSEFQRYRLQLNFRRLNGQPVNEILLQGTWSIGVHRPHPF